MGYPNEFHIGEFNPRPLISVIEQNLDPQGLQLLVQLNGRSGNRLRLIHIEWNDRNPERRHGFGPTNAIVIMVLFNGSRNNARNTDAIAAHGKRLRFAIVVEHLRIQRC